MHVHRTQTLVLHIHLSYNTLQFSATLLQALISSRYKSWVILKSHKASSNSQASTSREKPTMSSSIMNTKVCSSPALHSQHIISLKHLVCIIGPKGVDSKWHIRAPKRWQCPLRRPSINHIKRWSSYMQYNYHAHQFLSKWVVVKCSHAVNDVQCWQLLLIWLQNCDNSFRVSLSSGDLH